MLIGVHALIYSPQAEQVRAFLRDVLRWPSVDAGNDWLIFGLPPAELAVHPGPPLAEGETSPAMELYLMCDDLDSTAAELRTRGVDLARPITEAGWGRVTAVRLPDGSALGLYQPHHATALSTR
jgi:predicted enzyme related to lactoylglutathione lyase